MSVKGGNYQVFYCQAGKCGQANWWVFAGNAAIPSCAGDRVIQTRYTWGYFVNDAVEPGKGQLLAAPINQALASWASCSPTVSPDLSLQPGSSNAGQDIAITRALATPADSDGTDIAADLVGTINWGDGSATSFATLSGGRGKRQHRRDPRAPFGNRVTTPVTVGSRPAGCSAPPTVRCCPTRNTPRPPARRR